jgi:hypothetical protein
MRQLLGDINIDSKSRDPEDPTKTSIRSRIRHHSRTSGILTLAPWGLPSRTGVWRPKCRAEPGARDTKLGVGGDMRAMMRTVGGGLELCRRKCETQTGEEKTRSVVPSYKP